jgi:type IX secretion system PorP/SprF family membrane protein
MNAILKIARIPVLLMLLYGIASCALVHAQQKIQFTQYMFNGLVINPAYAGAEGPLSLTFINREQWAGIEKAPSTQTLTAHSLFRKKQIGLGLSIVNDQIGVHRSLSVMTNYAYHLTLSNDGILSMGVQSGLYRVNSDYASLMTSSTNDPKLATAPIRENYFDFGFGFYYRTKKLQLGISCPELLPKSVSTNDSSSVKLNKTNTFLLTRYRYSVNPFVDLEPGFLIKYLSGLNISYDLNLNMIYREVLTTGLSYRKQESVDFLLKAQVTPQLQIGYSYDHPVGYISRVSNGSHELMVQYLFRYVSENISSPR